MCWLSMGTVLTLAMVVRRLGSMVLHRAFRSRRFCSSSSESPRMVISLDRPQKQMDP